MPGKYESRPSRRGPNPIIPPTGWQRLRIWINLHLTIRPSVQPFRPPIQRTGDPAPTISPPSTPVPRRRVRGPPMRHRAAEPPNPRAGPPPARRRPRRPPIRPAAGRDARHPRPRPRPPLAPPPDPRTLQVRRSRGQHVGD